MKTSCLTDKEVLYFNSVSLNHMYMMNVENNYILGKDHYRVDILHCRSWTYMYVVVRTHLLNTQTEQNHLIV